MIRTLPLLLCLPLICNAQSKTYLNPPDYLGAPDASRAENKRAITMVPSIETSKGGRMWATWYAGVTPDEDNNNYVVLATSHDAGETWEEVLVADPDGSGPARAFDPEIWIAPDGNLYWTWGQTTWIAPHGHNWNSMGVWAVKITNPEEATPDYEAATRLTDGVMMCKPIALSTGEWALPVSTWRRTDSSARMVVSTDEGKTWTVKGAVNVPKKDRSFDEHMIVERTDGSLWLLARTKYGIGESISTDGGQTWPELTPSSITHTDSRFFIQRLDSGNLLLVKHGLIDEKTGRSHLRAFISTDDGKNWQGGLLLDERFGVSYPDGKQAEDGTIYITYDYSRRDKQEILFASFREEDAQTGLHVSDNVRLHQLISKGFGGQIKQPSDITRKSNTEGQALIKEPAGVFTSSDMKTTPFKVGEKLFADRDYQLAEVAKELDGYTFAQAPLSGKKRLVCSQAGILYFLTPQPDRNDDSQEAHLLKQGFEKVALPEVLIFSNRAANLSTLYQKHCQAGDTINWNKWAIPVFAP